jgi:hypothetical protein
MKEGQFLRVRGELEALEDYKHGQEIDVRVIVDRVEIIDEQNGGYTKLYKAKISNISEYLSE